MNFSSSCFLFNQVAIKLIALPIFWLQLSYLTHTERCWLMNFWLMCVCVCAVYRLSNITHIVPRKENVSQSEGQKYNVMWCLCYFTTSCMLFHFSLTRWWILLSKAINPCLWDNKTHTLTWLDMQTTPLPFFPPAPVLYFCAIKKFRCDLHTLQVTHDLLSRSSQIPHCTSQRSPRLDRCPV